MSTTQATTKRITLATLKAFIRKNAKNLLIMQESHFDGMTDCVEYNREKSFIKVDHTKIDLTHNNLGIPGAWVVGSSRNWITTYDTETHTGIHVYNCCGSFTVAIEKATKTA